MAAMGATGEKSPAAWLPVTFCLPVQISLSLPRLPQLRESTRFLRVEGTLFSVGYRTQEVSGGRDGGHGSYRRKIAGCLAACHFLSPCADLTFPAAPPTAEGEHTFFEG